MGIQKALARLVVVSAFLLLPALASAQSSIVGVVRDASGGVLPGVTVEAASPALIEKVRSVTTDAEGRYRIVDLRPGPYTVTFTLPGFSTVRREGLELRAEFAATVNADMAVGAIEETLTVTGEAPIVDTRSSRAQVQFERDTLEALPGAGRLTTLSAVLPGATLTQENNRGVGGTSDRTHTRYSVHGGPEAQPIIDGMNQQLPNSTQGVVVFNQLAIQEVVLETSGIGADRDSGGMAINMIPRDGGNVLTGSATFSYSGPDLEMSNVNDDLLTRGLDPTRIGALKKFRDSGVAVGGPIKRDRLWFFAAAREGVAQQYADGIYWNKLQQPQSLLYEPDIARGIANTNDYSKDVSFRLTWQVTEKHKLVGSSSFQNNCNCVFNLLTTGARVTPEAAGPHAYYPNFLPSATWTYPATSNVLLEAGVSLQALDQNDTREEGFDDTNYRIQDQGLNLTYGNVATRTIPRRQFQQRFALSYLTGSHQFKTGVNVKLGRQGDIETLGFDKTIHGTAVNYRFNNGVPNQLTLLDAPWNFEERVNDFAFYAQDQWTINRLTLNLGVRYNEVRGSTPEQVLGEGYFVPERRFAPLENVPHYRNLSPRLGFAYDLFGTGRTALKASVGHYPEIVRVVTGNPANNLIRTTNRTWNDANRNYVPDCDLEEPGANGECGPWSALNFGQQTGGTRYADGALDGFNSQYHNWQGSVSLQHELLPGVGLNVGYYRTWYGGDCGGSGLTNTVTCTLVTDNLLVTPADYDQYLRHGADRFPPAEQRQAAVRPVRPEAGALRPVRPAGAAGLRLRRPDEGVQRLRGHGERAVRSGGIVLGRAQHGQHRRGQLRRGGFAAGRPRRILQGHPALVRGHGHGAHGRVSTAFRHPDERDLPERPRHSDHRAARRPERGDRAVARPEPVRVPAYRSVQRQRHGRYHRAAVDVRAAAPAVGLAAFADVPAGRLTAPARQLRRL